MNLKPLKDIAARENWSKQKLKSVRGQLLKMPEAEAREYLKRLGKK